MKFFLISFMLSALAQLCLAQTIVESMQTTNNEKTLSMNINGKRDGRPFRHTIQFDVMGMSQTGRDSLYQETVRALGILNITDVPGLQKPGATATAERTKVKLTCETCTGKGRLEVYGNGFTITRTIDSRNDGKHSFPFVETLNPGDYRLLYYQKRVLQIQSTFTVRAGQENVVQVK